MATVTPKTNEADRLPPQDIEAEKSLLGSMLLVNDVIDEVVELVTPDHFYVKAHMQICDAIYRMHESGNRGIDVVTVAEQLQRSDLLEEVGGVGHLSEILNTVPHAAHAKYYAQIVRDKGILRNLIYACTDILSESYDTSQDTVDILTKAEQTIFQIVEQQENTDNIVLKDILMDAFDRIQQRREKEGSISGLSTGFTDLDNQTNGFQPSELVILAARPSMGKTAFVVNIAEAVARHARDRLRDEYVKRGEELPYGTIAEGGVLIFSLEQSNLELAERLLCITAKLDGHKMRKGDLDDEEYDRVMHASSELGSMPMYIDDKPGRNMSEIGAIARRLKRKQNISLIIIDYLQLIEPEDKRAPREQQISLITRRLKFLAKEIHVPVIALAQLNRGVELREDKRPRLADLRESGAIEQDADIVMFLHRPDAYDPEDSPGKAEVVVAKHRSGPTGIVDLTWQKESMRFVDYSHMAEPDGGYFGDDDMGGF